MIDQARFKPKTVYVTYIAAAVDKVWQGLTDPAFTSAYFHGLSAEIEGRTGGKFALRAPDGSPHITGEVVEWRPPNRFACTWVVVGMAQTHDLPATLVSYDIEQAGEAVRLTVTESYQWDVPDAILSGGRAGWPAILSSLKSLLETGRPLSIKMQPPQEMIDALAALKR